MKAVAQPPDAARSPGQIDRPVGEFRGSGRYRADLTAGSVKIAETRVIADLLLHGVDESEWKQTTVKDNLLKARNPATALRLTRLSRQRLETMSPELWRMVRDGTVIVAPHAALGTACNGGAWVVVTNQEDINAVLGEMKKGAANDFSKIQGRFKTRLSLSSVNVDEVIQERLLAKRGEVVASLQTLHATKGDILKNQLSFASVGPTHKAFKDADDFVRNYPFGSANRSDIEALLMDKLSDALTKAQKKTRISNLLAAMARKDGSIRNQGSDKQSVWVLIQR